MYAHFVDRVRIAWPPSALLLAMHVGCVVGCLAGCTSTEILNSSGACVQGQSQQCTCNSGAIGVRTCGRDSEYGQCLCDAPSSGGSGGAAGTIAGSAGSPVGGSAGISTGGSAGIGGEAAVGGGSTMAGSGGVGGIAGATGGAGAGGVSGMTGGSAGAAGVMSGGTGGASGMGGAGGTSGMDGTGGNGGPGRDPKPGELYGDCLANGECDDGLLCVNDGSSGFPETYCSTTCDALNPMCPRSRGDGVVVCLFGICVR